MYFDLYFTFTNCTTFDLYYKLHNHNIKSRVQITCTPLGKFCKKFIKEINEVFSLFFCKCTFFSFLLHLEGHRKCFLNFWSVSRKCRSLKIQVKNVMSNCDICLKITTRIGGVLFSTQQLGIYYHYLHYQLNFLDTLPNLLLPESTRKKLQMN